MSIVSDYMDSRQYTEDLILSVESALRYRFPNIKVANVVHNLESGHLEISIVEEGYTAQQVTEFLDEISGRTKKKSCQ